MGGNFKSNNKFNNHGFGILEAIIAAAIMSIVMLGFADVMTFQTRGAHSVEKDYLYTELLSDIEQVKTSGTMCNTSFVGQSAALGSHMIVTYGTTTIEDITQAGYADFGGSPGGVKIDSLTITNLVGPPLGTPGTVQADMTLKADTQGTNGANIVGGSARTFVFKMAFAVDAAENITACGSGAGTTQTAVLSPSCATPAAAEGTCTSTLTWPTPFIDNNYVAACSLVGPVGGACGAGCLWLASISQTPTQITVTLVTGTASQSQPEQANQIDCIGIHP